MLIGCCHCGPLDSVSSQYASYSSFASSYSSSDSIEVGRGCFCIGSVSANTWRMDIDYGWNAQQGANIWCCALYRKQKSYLLRRVSSTTSVCYWESDERAGTTTNDPTQCVTYAPWPRAWMAIHGPISGYSNKWWPNGWAMSAGLLYNQNVIGTGTTVLPYAYRDPNGAGAFGQARPGAPINCLTPKVLDHWTSFYGPTIERRWIGPSGPTQFPCGTGFGTTGNDLIPPTITLTPVAS